MSPNENSPEPRARYSSPLIVGYGLLYGLLALVVLVAPLAYGASVYMVIAGILGCVFIVWNYAQHASVIEVWPDAVVAIYPFGNTRRIPFNKIRRLRIAAERTGSALLVYTGGWWADIKIWVFGGSWGSGPDPIDSVINAIRESAHLTRVRKSLFGMPIYERER